MGEDNKLYKVEYKEGKVEFLKFLDDSISDLLISNISIIYIYTKEEEEEREKEFRDALELISLQSQVRDEAIASHEEAVIAVARLSQVLVEAAPSEKIRTYLLSFLPTLYKVNQSTGNQREIEILKDTILWLLQFLPEEERVKYAAAL